MSRARVQDAVALVVDGRRVRVPAGTTVAAALLGLGITAFRASTRGEPRAPLCGMGICHECRVTIDGLAHRRACLVAVAEGMEVTTTGTTTGAAPAAGST